MEAKTRIKTHSKPTAWGIGLIALDLILDGGDPKPRLSAGGTCGNVMAILSRLGWNAVPVARLASGHKSIATSPDGKSAHHRSTNTKGCKRNPFSLVFVQLPELWQASAKFSGCQD